MTRTKRHYYRISAPSLAFVTAACGGSESPPAISASVPVPMPSPTVTLTPSAPTGFIGDAVTLSWASTNATTCTASGGWTGPLATSGSQPVTLTAATNNFSISCAGVSQTATASTSVTATEKPFFREVPNALPVATMLNGKASASDVIAIIDVNGDGKKDLAIHQTAPRYSSGSTGAEPTYNALHFYIQQADGTFQDQTSTYLIGTPDLGGDSRKVKVADINADGKPDLLYAINQEDGRSLPDNTFANAQLAAVVSTSAGYVIRKMGKPNWYHSVGAGRDPSGRIFMTGNGFTGNNLDSFYLNAAGTVASTGLSLPQISADAFEFYNDRLDSGFTDRLLEVKGGLNHLSVDGFTASASGAWSALPPFQFSPIIGTVQLIGFNGDGPFPDQVYNVNGFNMLAAFADTCVTRLSPNSSPIVLFGLGGAIIPNFTNGVTVKQNDLVAYSTFVGAKIENGAIARVPFTITNEKTDVESFFFACRDINGDNFDDIVRYPINSDGKPNVYLNNKAGGFTYIGQTQFPSIGNTDGWGRSVSSIMDDLDGDGIEDLIIGAFYGISTSSTTVQWHVYKGLKRLQ